MDEILARNASEAQGIAGFESRDTFSASWKRIYWIELNIQYEY